MLYKEIMLVQWYSLKRLMWPGMLSAQAAVCPKFKVKVGASRLSRSSRFCALVAWDYRCVIAVNELMIPSYLIYFALLNQIILPAVGVGIQ